MRSSIEIRTVEHPLSSSIRPPGSKSITNRALPLAALANGRSRLSGALDSDDTRAMIDSLRHLGITLIHDTETQKIIVQGCGGAFPYDDTSLQIGNSGTSIRFLTAILGVHGGRHRLDGIPRMRERPIGDLVDALNGLGCDCVAESPGQCPPVKIDSKRSSGGSIRVSGNVSSQYLSGLLMAAPLASGNVTIAIDGELISRPYVSMTLEVMRQFGVEVAASDELDQFQITGGRTYLANDYAIEPDASAASYFWAAAAICGGTATVAGLNRDALQGDVKFVECLQAMGCDVQWNTDSISVTGPAQRGIDVDMSDVSDTVQTLAAIALFAEGPTHVRNVAHNRVKETDRIGNLAIELRKFGVRVDEREDGLSIYPSPLQAATIETYDDHRMAMSLSLVGLRQTGVVILDPECVSKTYPDFFEDMRRFVSQSDVG